VLNYQENTVTED